MSTGHDTTLSKTQKVPAINYLTTSNIVIRMNTGPMSIFLEIPMRREIVPARVLTRDRGGKRKGQPWFPLAW